VDWLCRHWVVWFSLLTGVWVILPWVAPVLMHAGARQPAALIYLIYAPQCHQLPQRSYFLFGPAAMVPLHEIVARTGSVNPLLLRAFLGAPDLGWKVAWSDRMVSLYSPLFLGALLYWWTGRTWQPVRWSWRLLLPYLPLLIDGLSHSVDDLFALGIRTENGWLASLTNGAFPLSFYSGDAIGSFNWWMRLITGLVASFALVRQLYPHLDRGFAAMLHGNRSRTSV